MSEYDPGLQGAEAGQPQAEVAEQPAEQAPTYVTQDALDAALQRIEASIAKAVQSQTDRTLGGLKKSVEKKFAELTELADQAGVPPQVIEAEKARIWQEAIQDFRSGDAQPTPAQDEVSQVNNWIFEIADDLGVAPLYPKDPEFSQVNFQNPNPAAFKAQYEAAIRAKAARRKGAPAEPAAQTTPAAKAPIIGTGQPSGNPTLEQLTTRLRTLQQKAGRSQADWVEMQALEKAITAQIPRR